MLDGRLPARVPRAVRLASKTREPRSMEEIRRVNRPNAETGELIGHGREAAQRATSSESMVA